MKLIASSDRPGLVELKEKTRKEDLLSTAGINASFSRPEKSEFFADTTFCYVREPLQTCPNHQQDFPSY